MECIVHGMFPDERREVERHLGEVLAAAAAKDSATRRLPPRQPEALDVQRRRALERLSMAPPLRVCTFVAIEPGSSIDVRIAGIDIDA